MSDPAVNETEHLYDLHFLANSLIYNLAIQFFFHHRGPSIIADFRRVRGYWLVARFTSTLVALVADSPVTSYKRSIARHATTRSYVFRACELSSCAKFPTEVAEESRGSIVYVCCFILRESVARNDDRRVDEKVCTTTA